MKQELEALRALGLTEYGARAYRALVSLGASEASVVAEAAPIPRTKVYAVLGDLARRGWIEAEGGRPRRYRAKPPAACFDRERTRIDALLDVALPSLEAEYRDRSTRFAGPMWILEGAEAVAQRTLEMVQSARKEIMLLASFPLPGDEKALAQALRAAVRRDVRVRLAVPDDGSPSATAFAKVGVPVRILPPVPPRFAFVDGRQGMVAMRVPRPGGVGVEVKAIWNPAPEMMEMMGGAILAVWDMAEDQAGPR